MMRGVCSWGGVLRGWRCTGLHRGGGTSAWLPAWPPRPAPPPGVLGPRPAVLFPGWGVFCCGSGIPVQPCLLARCARPVGGAPGSGRRALLVFSDWSLTHHSDALWLDGSCTWAARSDWGGRPFPASTLQSSHLTMSHARRVQRPAAPRAGSHCGLLAMTMMRRWGCARPQHLLPPPPPPQFWCGAAPRVRSLQGSELQLCTSEAAAAV